MQKLPDEIRDRVDDQLWLYAMQVGLKVFLDVADFVGVFDAIIYTREGKVRVVGLTDEEAVKFCRSLKEKAYGVY